jgi:hypothetical protein
MCATAPLRCNGALWAATAGLPFFMGWFALKLIWLVLDLHLNSI